MPIDFQRIADRFAPDTSKILKSFTLLFAHLAKWLTPRAEQIGKFERATAAFPILRFHEEALTAYIAPFQQHTLTPLEPALSIMEGAGRGARGFLSGLGGIPRGLQQTTLIPRFLANIRRLLEFISGSIERYQTPNPAMFDPSRTRNFLDIAGQAALFMHATASSLAQIDSFTQNAAAVQQAWAQTFGRETGTSSGGAGAAQPTFERIDSLNVYLVDAILAIPLVISLVSNVLMAGFIRAQMMALDTFERIEQKVFDLRGSIADMFGIGLWRFSEKAFSYIDAFGVILHDNLRYYSVLAVRYFETLVPEVQRFLGAFSTYMTDLMSWLRDLLTGLDRLMDIDITTYVPGGIGNVLPALRLRDLMSDQGEALGDRYINLIENASGAVGLIPGVGPAIDTYTAPRRLALQEVIRLLTRDSLRRGFLAELSSTGGAFRTPPVNFPNFYDQFFGPGAPPIADILRTTSETAQARIDSLTRTAAQSLDAMSARFRAAADEAAQLDPSRFQGVLAGSNHVAGLFDGSATAQPDGFARAFETAFANGGFATIGAIIPIYVEQMERYWQEQRASDVQVRRDTPTSPHILARRQRLGRVETPAVVIRLHDRPLDAALLEETASQFLQALNQVYQIGLGRHRQTVSAP